MSTKRVRRHVATPSPITPKRIPKKFTELPLDVLLNILSFLQPKDIISIRKCSKILYDATNRRTTWITATRNSCFECNIFEPTFPLQTMTRLELEHAATSRDRFVARLRNDLAGQQSLRPISTRVISPSSSGQFKNLMLIPGGRFLLTSSTSNVQLWDLGFAPHVLINLRPLATLVVHNLDDNFEFLTHPTSDGKGILVLIIASSHDEMEFSIYEIFPASKSPTFHRVAALSLNEMMVSVYALSGDSLAFQNEEYTIVWNFLLNEWVKWKWHRELRISGIILSDTDLIFLEGAYISIFKIPAMVPYTSRSQVEADVGTQTPLLRLVLPLEGDIYFSQPTWNEGLTRPCYLDVICSGWNGRMVCRYALKRVDNKPSDGLPGCIPIMVDSIEDDMVVSEIARFRSVQLADHGRLMSWLNGSSLQLELSTITPSAELPARNVSGIFYRWADILQPGDILQFSLCPMTGRFCVFSRDQEIRVLDYVMPPSGQYRV